MKMNILLIKEILTYIDENGKPGLSTSGIPTINYSIDEINFNCKLLLDNDFINGKITYADGSIYIFFTSSLTDKGRYLLNSMTNKSVWKKLKKQYLKITSFLILQDVINDSLNNSTKNMIIKIFKWFLTNLTGIITGVFIGVISTLILTYLTK